MEIISKEKARIRIAKRIAQEFNEAKEIKIINLGVGIPTMVANYINNNNIYIQSENGMLGVGPLAEESEIDRQLINAGRQPVTETPGCCYFDSATSFGMIRGGHIDATVIGAFEIDQEGNIANWIIPNGKQLGVGGAMDLVTGAKKVIVAMRHNQNGKPKILKKCKLPITGLGELDMLVTELAVFFFDGQLILEEIAPEIDIDTLKKLTEAEFKISPNLKKINV
ncbi:MAG: acetate CoA/acetoacetate CoA-transferase beta subunit [Thermosediminibacterales bacterium]|nr:acetate CoA/acetoacetate CoA-transferase beta subunit [Thermosediminibacterales bacterium]MDK2835306.1 acetate CoA/acetoacetate CoA-transferase beta subunit [Thermosediminibacterales bacterium]